MDVILHTKMIEELCWLDYSTGHYLQLKHSNQGRRTVIRGVDDNLIGESKTIQPTRQSMLQLAELISPP